MHNVARIFFLLGIILGLHPLHAQRLGLLPPSIKWNQLRDDSIRIIYPEGQDAVAKRAATIMLNLARLDPVSTNGRYRRINILLQPHTNISNGYVGLAPYVSEFYLQANENPFQLGSLPWSDLLSVHEYRHVLQVNAANTGISHIVKAVFGDLAFSGVYALAVPDWYREGDAVYAETKWTLQGRGRLSNFTLPFHQKLLQGNAWPYYVLRNGSYRQYTPDHYPLGYLLVQYGNHLFGENTWDTIIHEAASYKHLFSPFSGAVEERTGLRNKFLYGKAMDWYRELWKSQLVKDVEYNMLSITNADTRNDFFDMTYPSAETDGSIYTAISTFDHTTAIYKMEPDSSRKKLVSMGIQQETNFDHSGHRLVWTELRFDPRWARVDKNVVVVFDELTNDKMDIKPIKGFYSPALDKKGYRIVVLHEDMEGLYNLQILDARNGAVLTTLPNIKSLYLGNPAWSEDEKSIIACARDNVGRMALIEQDIATGTIRNITPFNYQVLGKPVLHNNWILLSTDIEQLDQVYAVDKASGDFYRISGGNTAHYDPAWDYNNDMIVCSEYRLNGKKLVYLPGDSSLWKKINPRADIKEAPVVNGSNLIGPDLKVRSFEIKKYSPWSDAINIHSWTVTANDPVFGAEIRSNNIMNNISIVAGMEYNKNSKAYGPYADINLGMLFPVISFGISETNRNTTAEDGRKFRVSNDRLNAGLSLPLYFSSGVYQQTVFLSSKYFYGLSKLRPVIPEAEDFKFNYVSNRLLVINSRRRAYRQYLPTWGQRFDATYSHEVGGVPISQLYASGDLALPAFKASHYTLVSGEFLSQDISETSIQLGSDYAGPRGFPEEDGSIQYKVGIDYGFPIAYPDVGIGNIFYTKRIRLQPFVDFGYVKHAENDRDMKESAGLEVLIDFHFPPLTLGLRYSRLLSGYEGNPNSFEVFLPIEKF